MHELLPCPCHRKLEGAFSQQKSSNKVQGERGDRKAVRSGKRERVVSGSENIDDLRCKVQKPLMKNWGIVGKASYPDKSKYLIM